MSSFKMDLLSKIVFLTLTSLLIVVEYGICVNTPKPGVAIKFSPQTVTEGDTPQVEISCKVSNPNFKDVVILTIRKSSMESSIKTPIALIRAGKEARINTRAGSITSRLQNVSGNITMGQNMYLSVTVINPVIEDSGVYECDLFYVANDQKATIDPLRDNDTLTVHPKPTPSTTLDPLSLSARVELLESALSNLIDRTVVVESHDPTNSYMVISLSQTEKQEIQKVIRGNYHVPVDKTKVTPQMKEMTDRIAKLEAYVVDLASSGKLPAISDTSTQAPSTTESSLLTDIKDIKDRVDDLEKQNQHQDDSLIFLRQIESNRTTIAFSACFKVNVNYVLQKGEELPFKDIEVNKGNAYDSKTGKFTAPLDGVYSFQLTLSTKRTTVVKHELKAALEINDVPYAYLSTPGSDISTISPVVPLHAGDVVKVKIVDTDKKTLVHGGQMTRFSGFLIN